MGRGCHDRRGHLPPARTRSGRVEERRRCRRGQQRRISRVVYDQSRACCGGAPRPPAPQRIRAVEVTDGTGRFDDSGSPPRRLSGEGGTGGLHLADARRVWPSRLGTQVEVEFTMQVASVEQGHGRGFTADRGPYADRSGEVVITQQQIANLPINGRDFISFSVITPGVTRDNTPQQGASATSGLTFAGQRARSNSITVDGLDNNDITVGRSGPCSARRPFASSRS